MDVVVLYESAFGNTAVIARSVADGIGEVLDVRCAPFSDGAPPGEGPADLLVVGGPTHAFGMSRPSTRADAAARAGTEPPSTGLREWVESAELPDGQRVATFDTRATVVRRVPGSAARAAARALRHRGCTLVDRPTSFFVTDVEGPLAPGEVERARAWGRSLADALPAQAHA
ncbi:flavodoxin/nitric oxide synthase [Oerskovia flava]|uniref:flavodoxin/nitric oxide synthase n=1 Tax=Oerskovia flava TaxID=2986422 RepID=UPI00223E8F6C|nr:flavodoxin/nitric oxide synthase [Oerskovia sp. JB1-3-2]